MVDGLRGHSKYVILAILNIALLVWFLSISAEKINLTTTQNVLQNLDFEISATIVLLQIVLLILYGKRLSLIMTFNQVQAITSCAVGFACNNLLPFRLGDGIRAAFTNIYLKIAIPDVILFMIIEKILDLSFIIILLILVFFLSPIFLEINSFIPLIFLFFVALSLAVSHIFLFSQSR